MTPPDAIEAERSAGQPSGEVRLSDLKGLPHRLEHEGGAEVVVSGIRQILPRFRNDLQGGPEARRSQV